jgi:hypothetical protein
MDARRLKSFRFTFALATWLLTSAASALPVSYAVDLREDSVPASPTPFISVISSLEDSNDDGAQELVLRLNIGDPSLSNPYSVAEFRIFYGSQVAGMVNLNIGDSITNNGGGGDAATQSNDAELNIGAVQPTATDMYVFDNDDLDFPFPVIRNVAGPFVVLDLVIGNRFVLWDNHLGVQGGFTGPGLFALEGQPDSEGPVNYNIFAAFNRVISGPSRQGVGVERAIVCLREAGESSCLPGFPDFEVPAPGSLWLIASAVLALGFAARKTGGQQLPARGSQRPRTTRASKYIAVRSAGAERPFRAKSSHRLSGRFQSIAAA